ncbi:rhodanese-like domain-containing protein [Alkalimonas delamerensis]|uniref:Rhodanese-like domain-containing protein n=1 Tax=Alkalimonas delamerensis TaxID=265981 RepID=A0ABT9GKT0_9GAMM|nr:rhodanese-like domain-containing protein [Alkalimonas delamerensis]MDP4527581.1 rhodanese-like domain-containing protein [Alkalimonas delamerensis]
MEQWIEFIGNNLLLSLIWAVLAFMLVFGIVRSRLSSIKLVSPTELTMLVNRQNAVVVDVRADVDFAKGHITGAKHMPLNDLVQGKAKGLEKLKSNPIIVVCQAGVSAQKAAAALQKQGCTSVSVLQGGMNNWQGASLPVVRSK